MFSFQNNYESLWPILLVIGFLSGGAVYGEGSPSLNLTARPERI